MIIEYNGIAVGVIGIINIDKRKKANIILHLEKTNIREKEFREKQQI